MKLNKYIDHTLLKADATEDMITELCMEAKKYDFASVCINPCWIQHACRLLTGTDVKICTVIGFPLGAMTSDAKAMEAADAVSKGADEVDMVLNISMLKDGNDSYVTDEIRQVKKAVGNHTLKVIIETCLLSDDEKVRACADIEKGGADFVKTSTGFSKSGATVSDVALLKKTVGNRLKIKAAGGVRTMADMEAMIQAGADRIGTSHGKDLMEKKD